MSPLSHSWSHNQHRIFGDLLPIKDRVLSSLKRTNQQYLDPRRYDSDKLTKLERALTRYQYCQTLLTVQENSITRRHRVVGNSCNHRLCPHCALMIADRRRNQFVDMIRAVGETDRLRWRFITLTLKPSSSPLCEQIEHLRASFRRLRQQLIWKKSQLWGKAVVEITMNPTTLLWHPHLHVICYGAFLPQKELSKNWYLATDGSYVCDIRSVSSDRQAANYVSKYMSKGITTLPEKAGDGALDELVIAFRENRTLISFGKKPCTPGDEEEPLDLDEDERKGDWIDIGTIEQIENDANNGDERALAILRELYGDKTDWFDDSPSRHHHSPEGPDKPPPKPDPESDLFN